MVPLETKKRKLQWNTCCDIGRLRYELQRLIPVQNKVSIYLLSIYLWHSKYFYNYNCHYFSVSQMILMLLFLHKIQNECFFGFGGFFGCCCFWFWFFLDFHLEPCSYSSSVALSWLWILKAAQTFYSSLIWAPQCLYQELGKSDWAGTLITILTTSSDT